MGKNRTGILPICLHHILGYTRTIYKYVSLLYVNYDNYYVEHNVSRRYQVPKGLSKEVDALRTIGKLVLIKPPLWKDGSSRSLMVPRSSYSRVLTAWFELYVTTAVRLRWPSRVREG